MKKIYRIVFASVFTLLLSLALFACDSSTKENTTEKITTKNETTTKANTTTENITTKSDESGELDPSNSYTVTYYSEIENITMEVYWNEFKDDEFLPVEHPLTSGDRVLKEEPICADVTNNSDKDALAIIFIDGAVSDFRKVEAGKKMSPGFYNRQLDGDMIIKVEEYKECNVSYTALTNTTIKVYDYENTFDVKEVANGGILTKYNCFRVSVNNNSSNKVLVKITTGDKTYLKTVNSDDSYETDPLYILDDLNVETLTITGYTVTTNIDSSISTDFDDDEFIMFTVYYQEFDENFEVIDNENPIIPTGMPIFMSVFNLYATPLTITVTYSDVTKTISIPQNDYGILTEKITPTGNVTITITK